MLLLLLVGTLVRFYLHRSSSIKCPPLWHISPIRIQMNAHLQYKHSARPSTNTVLRHTQTHTIETGNRAIITVLCVESKQKQQTKWTANHIEKFNENKRTNGRSCRCQQPTTIQHQRENDREIESERGAERERAQAREQPAFNSASTLTVAAAVRKQEIVDCPLQQHNNCG